MTLTDLIEEAEIREGMESKPKKSTICSYWTRHMERTATDERSDRPWKTEKQRNEIHVKWAKEDEQDPPCGTCDTCFLND